MSTTPSSAPYTWRPLQYDDLPALYGLLLAVSGPEDRIDTLADMQSGFEDPWSDPAVDSIVAFAADGQMAAYGRCSLHPEPEREAVVHLDYEIHPMHWTPAVHDRLFEWLERRGRIRLQTASAGLPRSIRTGIPDDKVAEIDLLERHGFEPLRYFFRMRRDLHQPIPERPLPAGVRLQRYTPADDETMRVIFNEAFKDHWGHEEILREDWEKWFVGSDTFRPDLSLLAFAGDDAVGITFCTVSPDDNARSGRQECNLRDVAVLRPWRKQGIASALISESLRLMRAAGLDYAGLGVDTASPTGALGVYEKLGFVPVRRFVVYDKKVI
jgi:mycothiol synthase